MREYGECVGKDDFEKFKFLTYSELTGSQTTELRIQYLFYIFLNVFFHKIPM